MQIYKIKVSNSKIIIKNTSKFNLKFTILDVYGNLIKDEIVPPNKKLKTKTLICDSYNLFVNNEFKEQIIVDMASGGILDLLDLLL